MKNSPRFLIQILLSNRWRRGLSHNQRSTSTAAHLRKLIYTGVADISPEKCRMTRWLKNDRRAEGGRGLKSESADDDDDDDDDEEEHEDDENEDEDEDDEGDENWSDAPITPPLWE